MVYSNLWVFTVDTPVSRAHNGYMNTVGEIGELALIEKIRDLVANAKLEQPATAGFSLKLGIGDDAAAWFSGDGIEVTTTDTVVENIHFTRRTMSWSDLGWKVIAANLSDIAAMGALPLYAVITLGLPKEIPVAAIEDLYSGMVEACGTYRAQIVGGDIVSSAVFFCSVTMNGVCVGEPLTRSSAANGDLIAVSGTLGDSAAGLLFLQGLEKSDTDGYVHQLVQVHRRPKPLLRAGQMLPLMGIRCAMDISDGLGADLSKLCRESNVAAMVNIDKIPISNLLLQTLPSSRALDLALNGGEDYQLIFTGTPDRIEKALGEIPEATVVGEIIAGVPGSVHFQNNNGDKVEMAIHGWEHLKG